jgi:thioredoxin-dependent peroxiredoxin
MSKVVVGSAVPSFVLPDLDGLPVAVGPGRGRKLLLSFLRNAQCAVCNLWVATATRRAPAWSALGLDVVAVFESSPEKLRAEVARLAPSFAVLADPEGVWHEVFASRTDPARIEAILASGHGEAALARAAEAGFPPRREEGSNFFRIPSEILVAADGTVAHVHVAESLDDHLAPERVEAFARGA